jgi:putative ABC transport system permease protein
MTDLRVSLRRLYRSPWYVAAVVASLGAGIAVCVAVFSLVNMVVFEEVIGIRDRSTLIRVNWTSRGSTFSTLEFEAFEQQPPSTFSSLAAHGDSSLPVMLPSGPVTLPAGFVSPRFFETLGTGAVIGRLLNSTDAEAGAAPAAAIAEELWRGPFNSAADVVGRSIAVGGHAFTIVGVTPATAPGLRPVNLGTRDAMLPQVWIPLNHARIWRATSAKAPWLSVAGRLSPGATLTDVRNQIGPMATWIRIISPSRDGAGGGERAALVVFRAGLNWRDEPGQSLLTLGLFLIIPISVLLIGCLNVVTLQLARALEQSGEMSVRLALGASHARLMRLMIAEVILISALSGAAGWAGARVLLSRVSSYLPTELVVDQQVFALAVALVVLVIASVGVVPAWLASRDVVAAGLRSLDDGGPTRTRVRSALLIVQVAPSVALLALSGLAMRSLVGQSPTLPADASEILLVDINLTNVRSTDPRPDVFTAAVLDSLHEEASIRDAAFATFSVAANSLTFSLADDPPGVRRTASGGFVTPRWFEATGARFLAGHGFADTPGNRSQAIVNVACASTIAPSAEGALGRQLRRPHGGTFEVVGVITDTQRSGNGDAIPMVILPMPRLMPWSLTLVARTRDSISARRAIEAAVRTADPMVPLGRIESLDRRTADHFRGFREMAWYGFALGALALALSAAGLHSLLSYTVRRRTREIGIRLAIGSSVAQVVWTVLRPALWLVVVGAGAGIALAMPISSVMRASLFGLSPLDVVSLLPAVGLLVLVALLASAVPALRASRVDPVRALREL